MMRGVEARDLVHGAARANPRSTARRFRGARLAADDSAAGDSPASTPPGTLREGTSSGGASEPRARAGRGGDVARGILGIVAARCRRLLRSADEGVAADVRATQKSRRQRRERRGGRDDVRRRRDADRRRADRGLRARDAPARRRARVGRRWRSPHRARDRSTASSRHQDAASSSRAARGGDGGEGVRGVERGGGRSRAESSIAAEDASIAAISRCARVRAGFEPDSFARRGGGGGDEARRVEKREHERAFDAALVAAKANVRARASRRRRWRVSAARARVRGAPTRGGRCRGGRRRRTHFADDR